LSIGDVLPVGISIDSAIVVVLVHLGEWNAELEKDLGRVSGKCLVELTIFLLEWFEIVPFFISNPILAWENCVARVSGALEELPMLHMVDDGHGFMLIHVRLEHLVDIGWCLQKLFVLFGLTRKSGH